MNGIQGWHIVILVVLALLLFGAPKLPGLARSMGQSLRIFKSEVRQMKDENPSDSTPEETVEGRIVTNPPAGASGVQTPPAAPRASGTTGTTGPDQRPAGNPPTGL
ncbi:Sec-independent protein translocase subunit TatA [Arthrobacter sp. zg-Y820]|uniref:Sec-independent protein translocase subunit TatA n=1 Tax=unclassified Arthrobacter TaxID=235627 RepID=UPI001E29D373|nr:MULTISPECIES: Sec-independent protein translocase subunit TatA [unclassified Arthrobacter]MCC9196694.1 Sec-independent protein translocase subunit TatA [Arthrobacter sp. zg-Y820]MDK1279556.1 Sec-independent protein translocase subunit TatA [Arthrobacter sp. zg.Y820]MDK1358826.1 Sec-independent protein translocase subunit TatA [Arthrobacter sp. zg-Y1219]WIB08070.1 Sec-independent protein translocase subunit TatA [Arthrobacter sp. zg-Y820]